MANYKDILTLLVVSTCTHAAPGNIAHQKAPTIPIIPTETKQREADDLNTASSSYSHQYSNWGGSTPGGYGFSITGFGTIDDNKNNVDPGYNAIGGYDTSFKNSELGNRGVTGYGNVGSSVGYGGGAFNQLGSFGSSGFGADGYGPTNPSQGGYGPTNLGPSGYGPSGLGDGGGYANIGAYGSGNGGYGGFGGNGGLNSYNGYNNPSYQGGGHLGYGYYNKKFGNGNIYSSGIAPNLVTGYRGYSRR